MYKFFIISGISVLISLGGCGTDYGTTGSAELSFETHEDIGIEKFKVKKAIALKRKEPHPTYHDIEIILSNYYVAISKQGTIIPPSDKDDIAFVIDLDHPTIGTHSDEFMVWVYKDNTNYCLSGEKWGCDLSNYHGDFKITELDDDHIAGTINYVHKTGAYIKSTFNVPFLKNH